jgi:hypothetical protein
MDDIVRQAMVKWPDVPDCYGWLGLDSRGQWWMRDDRVQALGAFQSGQPGAKGSLLRHEKLIDFIQRNYESDAQGQWYFQNGPQRVYIELEITPHIWRIENESTKFWWTKTAWSTWTPRWVWGWCTHWMWQGPRKR